MTSREVGPATVILGSEGSPRRPAPPPAGPRYPLAEPGAYFPADFLYLQNASTSQIL
jgi:hypothetical protein